MYTPNFWSIVSKDGFFSVTNGDESYNFSTFEFAVICRDVFNLPNALFYTDSNSNYWTTLSSNQFSSIGYTNRIWLHTDLTWFGVILVWLAGVSETIQTDRLQRFERKIKSIKSFCHQLMWGFDQK